MQLFDKIKKSILSIDDEEKFNSFALALFKLHLTSNPVYKEFIQSLPPSFHTPASYLEIPCLPISFFKNKKIFLEGITPDLFFTSSGTTGATPSKHYVSDLDWYLKNSLQIFERFYGNVEDYCILALLPSYLERDGSSLIAMTNDLIKRSKHVKSGFYLNDLSALHQELVELNKKGQKTILLGVSFALLEFIEKYSVHFPELIVMETGGMKGKREELIREDLHTKLKKGFAVPFIHSEYGMTELFSQAYAAKDGVFHTPPWMKLLIRDSNDPFSYLEENKVGGINCIDLANMYSCPFIATQDLGKITKTGIEILGRFDNSDIRGCNLMVF